MRNGYHLIPALKQNHGNHKFKVVPELGTILTRWLTILDTVWYRGVGGGGVDFCTRYNKCINIDGVYVEDYGE